jgi:hypothetical protein
MYQIYKVFQNCNATSPCPKFPPDNQVLESKRRKLNVLDSTVVVCVWRIIFTLLHLGQIACTFVATRRFLNVEPALVHCTSKVKLTLALTLRDRDGIFAVQYKLESGFANCQLPEC